MKKRTIWIMAAAAALLLSACANSDTATSSAGAGSGGAGQTSGSASVSSGGSDPSITVAGGVEGNASPAAAQPESSAGAGTTQETANASSPESSASGAAQSAETAGANTYDALHQTGDEDSAAAKTQNDWEGVFTSQTGEQLTVSGQTEYSFHFSFAVCGIYGQADIDGTQAVYKGDDDNNVVFTFGGDRIFVSVTNDNGDDTAESPVIGTYLKDSGEEDTAQSDVEEDTTEAG